MTNIFEVPGDDTSVLFPVPDQQDKASTLTQTDLNIVLQRVFCEENQRLNKDQVIVRCDQLPTVFIEESRIAKACSFLLNIILEQPPEKGKLFIYIRCNLLKEDIIDLSLPDGAKKYEVLFHTNCFNKPDWKEKYKDLLDYCYQMCIDHGGSFNYKDNFEGSYLFQLILPGKSIEHATG